MANPPSLLLLTLQKVIRISLRVPFLAPFTWKNIGRLRFYAAQHFDKGPFVTRFDGNIKLHVSLTDHIESQIFWQGVQEGDRGEVKLLRELFQPHHTFIDVGGNIGVFSLIAAKRLSRGMVHTFEPSPYHLKKMRANFDLNKPDNVRIHPFGLSEHSHSSMLYFPAETGSLTNTGMASQFCFDQPPSKVEDITCVRLDDYAKSSGITRVDVMKIDVEGAELDTLRGAIETIRANRPHVVMEINLSHLRRADRSAQAVIDYWHDLYYSVFRIGHDAELDPIHSVADFVEHQNIYCRPDELPEIHQPITKRDCTRQSDHGEVVNRAMRKT